MGIVVTIIMLLGLMNLRPTPWSDSNREVFAANFVLASMVLLFIGGFWNAVIYGFTHAEEFWGVAAIVSGIVMMAAGMFIGIRQFGPFEFSSGLLWAERLTVLLLFLSFLLYSITLIQINLGLSFIGQS